MGKKHQQVIMIETREDADRALQRIGALERNIAAEEKIASDRIDAIRAELVSDTAHQREVLAANEAALKEWARGDRKNWDGKSLELNFGTIGFRRPTPAIKLKLKLAAVIERLRAKKMLTCIRTVEKVNKANLAAYDDDAILDVGCERTKPKDKFWWECKKEEVK